MRLIDADALKEKLDELEPYIDCDENSTTWIQSDEVYNAINNAQTVPQDCSDCKRYDSPYFEVKFDKEQMQEIVDKAKAEVLASIERPQGELKEYKPLELDYNVKSAVENLKTAYWSNDTEKYAKAFTEAEEIIISAICHHGYIVMKGGAE